MSEIEQLCNTQFWLQKAWAEAYFGFLSKPEPEPEPEREQE